MAKTTLATIKSFVKKNRTNLLISCKSHFDGMCDGVRPCEDKSFSPIMTPDINHENTMNIQGAWFVFGGRDYFTEYQKDGLRGYEVYNCCGSFILAVKE